MFNFLARFLTKAYVKKNGHYRRIIGPQKLLDSIKGIGGYIVIGDEVDTNYGFLFARSIDVDSNSINGYNISQMEISPLSESHKLFK